MTKSETNAKLFHALREAGVGEKAAMCLAEAIPPKEILVTKADLAKNSTAPAPVSDALSTYDRTSFISAYVTLGRMIKEDTGGGWGLFRYILFYAVFPPAFVVGMVVLAAALDGAP